MKKIKLLVIGLLVSASCFAETAQTDSLDKWSYDYSVWDNTYVGVNVGVSAIVNGDNASKLGDNLSPLVNVNAGLHFSPYWGGACSLAMRVRKHGLTIIIRHLLSGLEFTNSQWTC